jgi:ligand-binding sensor domain-containing protein
VRRVAILLALLVAGCGCGLARSSDVGRFENIQAPGSHARVRDLKFTHLTANDGLSQDNIVAILQDHRGFMWFGTGDGLNRYDGNAVVVYKNNPNDPASLSANFIRDLIEDDHGYLWLVVYPGVNKFDPTTERCTRYLHDPNNANSLSGESVWSITRDSRGYLWFATADSGLDRFEPATETFVHYRNDSDGQFVGWITRVIEDGHGDIWFVGERGLFHLNLQTGQITRPPGIIKHLSADDLYEDNAGDFWMLAYSPIVGLVKYERKLNGSPNTRSTLEPPDWTMAHFSMMGGMDSGCHRAWACITSTGEQNT